MRHEIFIRIWFQFIVIVTAIEVWDYNYWSFYIKRVSFLHRVYVSVVMFKVINTTFNNISVIAWRSVLLVHKTGVPGENHRPVISHWQTLSHHVV